VNRQPPWRVIRGGSKRYVEKLTEPFRERVHGRTPVRGVRRNGQGVQVKPEGQDWLSFDHVILATHSDQALRILDDPSPEEEVVLGALRYHSNRASLHTDQAMLPSRRRARASWNYHIPPGDPGGVVVTYDMSRLQSLQSPLPFCVSLNPGNRVRPEHELQKLEFSHQLFDVAAHRAQARHGEINGARRTHYCGAYWGNGFHEDGVRSAVQVCEAFGASL